MCYHHQNRSKYSHLHTRKSSELYESYQWRQHRENLFSYRETETHHIRHHPELNVQEILWPVKKEAVVEGNLVLGGLMMVHEREDSVTCGPIMPQGGIQALEAMLYTLDRLNEPKTSFLPNITLGAHILDDCDKDTYGLEMAVDFIKGKDMLL
ncbi:metabotropic glutamate receptor 2-like [Photinus pyralis]|uniref:metabotropic glutamate receptor 2-like n=1 Tax=Photinus pyralis TaxID=7054 RepID=UPI00126744DB|nr:metabotropic glutamate receptor 2-like [Photinus pyralis]